MARRSYRYQKGRREKREWRAIDEVTLMALCRVKLESHRQLLVQMQSEVVRLQKIAGDTRGVEDLERARSQIRLGRWE